MKQLTVILGAGFSYNAGLPLGKDIQERFDRDLRNKFLNFPSGEWMWTDNKSEAEINNGTLSHKQYWYSYIFNEYLEEYKEINSGFIDYEDFYHYVQLVTVNPEKNSEVFTIAKTKLFEEHPEFQGENMYSDIYELPDFELPVTILNYLIWDLLHFSKGENDLLKNYEPFIKFIEGFDKVDIFTLNHDLLVEYLLEKNGLEYTKGFSNDNSEIQHNNIPLSTYQGNYDKFKIRLYKMHGSVDCYRFEHLRQDVASYTPTGNFSYYLPRGYRARHMSVRVNPQTGEIVQDLCFDVVPKFITGIDKRKFIDNDYMYVDLYKRFTSILAETDNLFISGYSFRDEHINEVLKNNKIPKIVNQNPYKKFPFDRKTQNIRYLSDIATIQKIYS
jgi:hypothetical protein